MTKVFNQSVANGSNPSISPSAMMQANEATQGLRSRFAQLLPEEHAAFLRLKNNRAFCEALTHAAQDESNTADHLSSVIAQKRSPNTLNIHDRNYEALALTNPVEIAVLKKLMNRSSWAIYSDEFKEREKIKFLNKQLRDTTAAPPQRAFEKCPPEKCFILSLDDGNEVVRTNAKTKALRNKIPPDNCFYYGTKAPRNPSGKRLDKQSLGQLSIDSRLTLIAHANEGSFARHSPALLALKLRDAGLRKVGILKLEGCNVGSGDYLEQLKDALNKLNVEVGYLSGPTGSHADTDVVMKTPFGRKAVDASFPFKLIVPPLWPHLFTSHSTRALTGAILPGTHLKIVKGNADITFPGTHYDLPKLPERDEV